MNKKMYDTIRRRNSAEDIATCPNRFLFQLRIVELSTISVVF
jgi:hypothetical protein